MARSKFEMWCRQYGLEFIRKLAEDGFSDEEIAKRAHISMIEYDSWKRRFKKFRDAIEIGRKEADFSVVEAVYKRATGYNVSTKKTHKLKRKNNQRRNLTHLCKLQMIIQICGIMYH